MKRAALGHGSGDTRARLSISRGRGHSIHPRARRTPVNGPFCAHTRESPSEQVRKTGTPDCGLLLFVLLSRACFIYTCAHAGTMRCTRGVTGYGDLDRESRWNSIYIAGAAGDERSGSEPQVLLLSSCRYILFFFGDIEGGIS